MPRALCCRVGVARCRCGAVSVYRRVAASGWACGKTATAAPGGGRSLGEAPCGWVGGGGTGTAERRDRRDGGTPGCRLQGSGMGRGRRRCRGGGERGPGSERLPPGAVRGADGAAAQQGPLSGCREAEAVSAVLEAVAGPPGPRAGRGACSHSRRARRLPSPEGCLRGVPAKRSRTLPAVAVVTGVFSLGAGVCPWSEYSFAP